MSTSFLELSDGELKTDDGSSFPVHKFELATKSEYFFNLFCKDSSKGQNEFKIPGISAETLASLLRFVSTGELDVTVSNAKDLLDAAHRLSLRDLVTETGKAFDKDQLTVSNCLPIYVSALKADCEDIMKASVRFILTHFQSVVDLHGSAMSELPLHVLEQFLNSNSLCVSDESLVWDVIRRWVESDVRNRLHLVPAMLGLLALEDVTEALARRILSSSIVADNPHCKLPSAESAYPTRKEVLLKMVVENRNASSSGFLATLASKLQTPLSWMTHSSGIPNQDVPVIRSRTPRIHLIVQTVKTELGETEYDVKTSVYVTRDEKMDFWRKIAEFDDFFPKAAYVVGKNVFANVRQDVFRYDLTERELRTVQNVSRDKFATAILDDRLYLIGGDDEDLLFLNIGDEDDDDDDPNLAVADVEYYDAEADQLEAAAPLIAPCKYLRAATIGRRIYVVGVAQFLGSQSYQMLAQSYCPDADEWTRLPDPPVFKEWGFAVAAYRDRLYVIAGRTGISRVTTVEVYDPESQVWLQHDPLPHGFGQAEAVVLSGELVVHDTIIFMLLGAGETRPLRWDEVLGRWMFFEDGSPMNYVHQYYFLSPDRETAAMLCRENREHEDDFVKSPFAAIY